MKTGTYSTPDSVSTAAGRLLARNRTWFYLEYLHIVFRSRALAQKGLYNREAWAKSSADVLALYERRGGQLTVEGLDQLHKLNGPVVFVANHMSTAETQILPGFIQPVRDVTFVVKDSLMKGPVFGPIMRAVDGIGVTQKDARGDFETVMKEGCERLAKGMSVVIFPEGTRNRIFQPSQFNSLGTKLAKRAGVCMMPVALKTDFWGNGKLLRTFGPLDCRKEAHFKFGAPVMPEGNGKEAQEYALEFIQKHVQMWDRKPGQVVELPGFAAT